MQTRTDPGTARADRSGGFARLVLVGLTLIAISACNSLFPTQATGDLAHFATEAPTPGTPAPDFMLLDTEGKPVKLSALVGTQPIVVQLGSYTCPVFRYRRFTMRSLREKYAGRVIFLVVYTVEAHPTGAVSPYRNKQWISLPNRLSRVYCSQPKSLKERTERATLARAAMQSNARFVVDTLDNATWKNYGRAPSAAYLIDLQGNIALRQPWVEPGALATAIDAMLSEL